MASHFGQPVADLLDAVDILDDVDVAVRLSGAQNGNLVMRDARRFAIPYYTRRPRTTDRMGMGVCISGAGDRGLYWNTGTEVIQAFAFEEDGSYADAVWDNLAFGSASALATSSVTPEQSSLVVSGFDNGALTLGQLPEVVVTWNQSALPLISDPTGHYGVQTTANRGWYFNTGTAIYQVLAYSQDGRWPV